MPVAPPVMTTTRPARMSLRNGERGSGVVMPGMGTGQGDWMVTHLFYHCFITFIEIQINLSSRPILKFRLKIFYWIFESDQADNIEIGSKGLEPQTARIKLEVTKPHRIPGIFQ